MMPEEPAPIQRSSRLITGAILLFCIVVGWFYASELLQVESLTDKESELRQTLHSNPFLVYTLAFGTYVAFTSLSIPGAAILSLFLGWYLGFWSGFILVSFASTTGATLAFLSSRYFLRQRILKRYGERLKGINQHLHREGAFYLFTLRLIPAVPFFLVNLLMGLTPIRIKTFWWVSQLGMLPGTAAYVYAGSNLPELSKIQSPDRSPILTPELIAGFIILGLLPWILKSALRLLPNQKDAGN